MKTFIVKVTYGNGQVSILRVFSLDEVSHFHNVVSTEVIK